MFCSWRNGACAACRCAYRLRRPLPEALNRLCHLGGATFVLRQQGLSVARKTSLCVASRESGRSLLRDQTSGIETDTRHPLNLYLIRDMSDTSPLLAMAAPGKMIHLSIRLDGHAWESPTVQNLIPDLDGVALDCIESRRLGAGAWLDEWEQPCRAANPEETARETGQLLKSCRHLEVEVGACGQRSVVNFTPSFVDRSGPVLRIADPCLEHVVYADTEDPDFRFYRTSPSHARIFKQAC